MAATLNITGNVTDTAAVFELMTLAAAFLEPQATHLIPSGERASLSDALFTVLNKLRSSDSETRKMVDAGAMRATIRLRSLQERLTLERYRA